MIMYFYRYGFRRPAWNAILSPLRPQVLPLPPLPPSWSWNAKEIVYGIRLITCTFIVSFTHLSTREAIGDRLWVNCRKVSAYVKNLAQVHSIDDVVGSVPGPLPFPVTLDSIGARVEVPHARHSLAMLSTDCPAKHSLSRMVEEGKWSVCRLDSRVWARYSELWTPPSWDITHTFRQPDFPLN